MLRVMMPILDSRGRPAAYWGTGGHVPAGPIYLGDTGTAAAAIAMISRHAPAAARERYVGALRKFFRFVMNGTQAPPPGGFTHNRTQASPGWQLPNGAFGAGYFVGNLTLTPYTVSTATTGMSCAGCWHQPEVWTPVNSLRLSAHRHRSSKLRCWHKSDPHNVLNGLNSYSVPLVARPHFFFGHDPGVYLFCFPISE